MPRTRIRTVIIVLVFVCALAGLGPPAAGQATTSDPYGSTVPPTEPPGDPSCSVADTQVEVGGTVTGEVVGLEAGTEVDLTLLGQVLETVVADADGTAEFSFTVPEIAGISALVAVGVTFNVACGDLDPGAVLGENEERPETGAPGSGPGVSGGSGDDTAVLGARTDRGDDGLLARTGTTLLPLVVLALLALALGAYLRRRSHQRRFA